MNGYLAYFSAANKCAFKTILLIPIDINNHAKFCLDSEFYRKNSESKQKLTLKYI